MKKFYLPNFHFVFIPFLIFFIISIAGTYTCSYGQVVSFFYNQPTTVPDGACFDGYEDAEENLVIPVFGVGVINAGVVRIDSIKLDISMTWNSDLQIWLESPSGEILELSTNNGGSSDDYANTVFSDDAIENITEGFAPFSGMYKPEGRQNTLEVSPGNGPVAGTYTFAIAFANIAADGNWKLRVCDAVSGDIPLVNSWSIHFTRICSEATNDLGLNQINGSSVLCGADFEVNATIINFGNNIVDSFTVNWSVNDTLQTPYQFEVTLDSCSSTNNNTTVTLGTVAIQPGSGYNIKVWTSFPNGVVDTVPQNDTLTRFFSSGLIGEYTVGGIDPDFSSLAESVEALETFGLCGPVTFKLRSGTYTEQLSIPEIASASSDNTITFESESGDSTDVVLGFDSPNADSNYVIRLSGGDWFRFRNMTLEALDSIYSRVVVLESGATNNIFEYVHFRGIPTAISDGVMAISIGFQLNEYNTFQSNLFEGGNYGVVFENGTFENGNMISHNRFVNQREGAIVLNTQFNPIVSGNIIESNIGNTDYKGISIFQSPSGLKVERNQIILDTALFGISLYYCNGSFYGGQEALVTNNFIRIAGDVQADGILLNGCNQLGVYYNNVSIASSNANSRAFSAVYNYKLRLLNNIGQHETGGLAMYIIDQNELEQCNYNDFYTSGATLIYESLNNLFLGSLADWTNETGFDEQSLSVDPLFVSSNDLHVTNSQLNGQGVPIAAVNEDFDGDKRNVFTPDIGADEFSADSVDASIPYIVNFQQVPVGLTPVKVLISNNGGNLLTSLNVYLQVNNDTPVLTNWSGALNSSDTMTVTLNSVNFAAGQSYKLMAWSSMPNNVMDPNAQNDTARILTDGLVAYYSFCGCSADDNSRLENNGSFVGSPNCVKGKGGEGVLLNEGGGGNNGCGLEGGQYVELPTFDALWNNGFTVTAWARFDNPVQNERIIDLGNGPGDLGGLPVWFGREYTNNSLVLESWISDDGFVNSNTGRLVASDAIVNGVLQHYCATIKGDTMRIFVNGTLKAEKKGHPIANVKRFNNFLGHSNSCNNNPDFQGVLDEIRVYNRALSAAEINSLYRTSPSFAEYDSVTCAGGDTIQLNAQGGIAYAWSPAQGLNNASIANPMAAVDSSITYLCNITLPDGCVFTDSLSIQVADSSSLNGIYTIGGVNPDYATFTEAVSALSDYGVCGPVIFKVRNGTYNEQITINAIYGVDVFNPVTFESENGDSSNVILAYSSNDFYAPWTLRLLDVGHITFRKMTIEALGTSYSQAVYLQGKAQYNRFENNNLRSLITTSTSSSNAVIVIDGETSDNYFRYNLIENGSYGLYWDGYYDNGNRVSGLDFEANALTNQYYIGIYMNYGRNLDVTGNTVVSNSAYYYYNAIYVYDCTDSVAIIRNKLYDLPLNARGVYALYSYPQTSAPMLITDNFVEIKQGSSNCDGIYVYGASNVKILHNTVRVFNTGLSSSALLFQYINNGEVLNNILVNTGGGYACNFAYNSTFVSDYNDLYANGTYIGNSNGTTLENLNTWRTQTGYDAHSISVDPLFMAPGMYRPHALDLNGSANYSNAAPTDIEGQVRNTNNPDIGALEFMPDSTDAGLLSFIGLTSPVSAGQVPVGVLLRNNGFETLTSVRLSLRVNNDTVATVEWTGSLLSGDSIETTIDTINLSIGQEYDVVVWVSEPNGGVDQYQFNDTIARLNLFPALNGVYTVGGNMPDFQTFTAAVTTMNQAGIAGNVTFKVRPGVYNEQITLIPVSGTSQTQQVVFESENGDSTSVTLEFNANSSANYTVYFDGADWINFRKLTLKANNNTYGTVVQIGNGADNLMFEHNRITGISTTSTSSSRSLVYSDCCINDRNNIFLNNHFLNGSYGLLLYGSLSEYETGLRIENNKFEGQYYRSVNLVYQNNALIEGNEVRNLPAAYFQSGGIVITNSTNEIIIRANQIFMATGTRGISIQYCIGTANNRALIANNFIRVSGSSTGAAALYANNSSYFDCLHNTVHQTTTQTTYCAAEIASCSNAAVRNNIFMNTGGGYALCVNNSAIKLQSNYNDLFSTGINLASYLGTPYQNLANWQNGTGFDLQSISVNPKFVSPDDLHVADVDLNMAGTPSPRVPTDIDGELRDTQHPDIGADEFMLVAADAGIEMVAAPAKPFAAGMIAVPALIKNHGTDTLTSVTVRWHLNGQLQSDILWTGALASGDTQYVELDTINFQVGQPVSIVAWAESPNMLNDSVPSNDTASVLNVYAALDGVYTIGGVAPDFASFTTAVNALHNGGVLDTVVFNVRNGVYTEQLVLNQIFGASADKTVTFQSEINDSTLVTLQFNANSSANYVLQLNGADWVRFRKMTLQATNTTYARVIDITNGSNNNVFENNRLIGVSTTSTSNLRVIVYSAGFSDNGNVFRQNHFRNGADGIQYFGVSNAYETGTVIENNIFENQYRRSINIIYNTGAVVSGNTIYTNSTYTPFNGIVMYLCNGSQQVNSNILRLTNSAIGIAIDNCVSTDNNRGLVANNFVQIGGTVQVQGIYFIGSRFHNVFHNSVHINNSNALSSAYYLGGGSEHLLYNNIGYCSSGALVLYRNSSDNISVSDHNDWYTTGSVLVNNNGANLTDLAAWQGATGFDAASISVNPQFVSATDLHTNYILLNGRARPLGTVTVDIDGQSRDLFFPDMGADEFNALDDDASVSAINYPVMLFPAGQQPVEVRLRNNGSDTLQSVTINWQINNDLQQPFAYTGNLLPGEEVNVSPGTFFFTVNTSYNITAWSSDANGTPDVNTANDTARVINQYASLSGIYTIGGATPDFTSFAQAVEALHNGGVVDDVVLNVRNGTYTEQVLINQIQGAAADKTITFQSESGDSSLVKLTFNATSTNNYTLRLNGADWLRFNGITLEGTNTSYGRVVHLLNGATDNLFSRCVLQSNGNSSTSSELVYSEATNSLNNTNFTFENNRCLNGDYALELRGLSNNYNTGTIIRNNDFSNAWRQGVNLLYHQAPVIEGNTLTDNNANNFNSQYGFYLNTCRGASRLVGNKISMRRAYGIYLDNSDNTVGSEGLIANNFVEMGQSSANTVYGIYFSSSDGYKVYHNNINVTSTGGSSRAFYSNVSSNINLLNNIFACSAGTTPIQFINGSLTGSNYNDYYTTGARVGIWNGTDAPTLAEWQLLSNNDLNSYSVNPLFTSDTDLHTAQGNLNSVGTPVAEVTVDIDGQPRNPTNPDIGADEFTPVSANDAGIQTVLSPNKLTAFTTGSRPVKVLLRNFGLDTIESLTIKWLINNTPQTEYIWNGTLYPDQSDTVTVGNFSFGLGEYLIKVFTFNPDGMVDTVSSNDTASVSNLYAALQGTYTIGGILPDFSTFNSAITQLKEGGVLGAVTLNARNGVYDEAIVIKPIRGTSTMNTVTFQSESGDSSAVTLRNSAQQLIQIDGADHMRFRKMTFENNRYASPQVFALQNGVVNCSIANSRLLITDLFSYGGIGVSESDNASTQQFMVQNCSIENGEYGIYLNGASSRRDSGVAIINNRFQNQTYAGVYAEYGSSFEISQNEFDMPAGDFGLRFYYFNGTNRITKNKIALNSGTGVFAYGCDMLASNPMLVANNFISTGNASGSAYGLNLQYCANINLYFNNIRIGNSASLPNYGLYNYYSSGLNSLNNIFANFGGSYACYTTSLDLSNFNDLYTNGPTLGIFGFTDAADMAAWRTLTGKDQNSLSINPLFVSASDLHVSQTALDSAGTYLSAVTDDIDGQARNNNFPDIGADEISFLGDDVGISAVLLPVSDCNLGNTASVKVRIQNFSASLISGFDVAFRVDNGVATVENIGALVVLPGLTVDYTFAASADLSAFGNHLIEAWTLFSDDTNSDNDTVRVSLENLMTPAIPSNLLPADNIVNLSPINIMFSWAPSQGATRYDFYLWKEGFSQPSTPTVANLTQINLNYSIPSPEYGGGYEWRVVAKNPYCFTLGSVQSFTLVNLPDLIAENVQIPALAFSGQTLSVDWQVMNIGPGSTGMSSWKDVLYLSENLELNYNDDIYLGETSNFSALDTGQSYVGSGIFNVANGFVGEYYVFVVTDRYSSALETNNNNNQAVSAGKVTIQLTPPPDLQVNAIVVPNNAFSSTPITVNYTVTNQGPGGTVSGSWQDRIYFGPNQSLNLAQATFLGSVNRNGNLLFNASYNGSVTATIPQGADGTYYVHVVTDYFNDEYEQANEGNNTSVSTPIQVTLTPPADLVVINVNGPSAAHNLQQVSVTWTVENQGGSPANEYWYDQVFVSNIPNNINLTGAINLGTFGRPKGLGLGETYDRSASVTVPDNITGSYYFYVKTDAGNGVFEHTFESNNVGASGAKTITTPDLAVLNVSLPANAGSGDTITVQWRIENAGNGKLSARNVVDRVYITVNNVYNPGGLIQVGQTSSVVTLNPGEGQNRQLNAVIPQGISGSYYVYVLTDAVADIYENAIEANNANQNGVALNVTLSPWADLTPTAITGPPSAPAGATVNVAYSVKNIGNAAVEGLSWGDKVYIQSNPQWNAATAQLIRTQVYNLSLPVDSSYNVVASVGLPLALPGGNYYLFIYTDADNNVYEFTGENNNLLGSSQVNISGYPPVDLAVTNVTQVPDSAKSGQTIPVSWQVGNLSANNTIVAQWTDAVYLSTDSFYNAGVDQQLATRTQTGPLAASAVYTANTNVVLPNGISGNYYLIVFADVNGQHNDSAPSNNRKASDVLPITLTPPPNLLVEAFTVPGQGTSGQSLSIPYRVRNNGIGDATGNWTDRIYLSTDFNLDGSDQLVGYKARTGGLAEGSAYADTIVVSFPLSQSGNRILILKTDDNNAVYEGLLEGDNTSSAAIVLLLPPPCDLVVQNITAPATALAGKSLSIGWRVRNMGANPASGFMKESIYLSLDTLWDVSDPLLGTKSTNLNLAPGAFAQQTLTADLVNVALGDYYVIVRTDILNNINEISDQNNQSVMVPPVEVNVSLLSLGVLTPDTLTDGMPLYYRIEIPDSLAGESLLLQLRGDTLNAANELYVRRNQVPSRTVYDFGYSNILQADQDITVPVLEAGTYYVLAYGNTAVGNKQPVNLLARILNFEIREVTENTGGNNGLVTVRIDGAKFESGMDVWLERPGTSVPALCVIYQDPTRVFVQFDLHNRPLGVYDVVAGKNNGQEARLVNGFTVIPGNGEGIAANIVAPPSTRPNNVVPIKVEFINNGNTDYLNPVVELVSMGGAFLALDPDDINQGQTVLEVPLRELGAPLGWLRPGAAGTVTVYVSANNALSFLIRLPE